MKKCACAFLLVLIIVIPASVSHASLAAPGDLSPGDQFHWAFITKAEHRAFYTDITTYNNFVDMEAERDFALTKGLGIEWRAVASTETVDAKDNVNVTGPVYRVDRVRIADDAADLWDGILLDELNIDQFGNVRNHKVWTGTGTNGSKDGEHYLGSAQPTIGLQPENDQDWIAYDNAHGFTNTTYFPMYAISEVQTVQTVVPVPAAVWLLGSGMIGLVGIRRKFTR